MSRPRIVTVEPVLFAFMLCVFLSFPIREQLIYQKICQSKYNSTVCNGIKSDEALKKAENIVQSETSNWMLYFNIALTLPSMASAMFLGPCSDKIGRKFVMILPLIGNGLDAISMILNAYFSNWHVAYMLFGVMVSGFFGSFAMLLSAVFAYMSDITNKENRTLRLTILESMTFVGGCVGELIGGLMVDNVGYFITFIVLLAIHVLNLLYVLILVNESYFPDVKMKFSEMICNGKQIVNSIKVFTQKRPNSQRKKLLLLLVSFFFGLLVFTGSNTVKVLFSIHRPLSFSSTMVGYFLAASMLYRGVGVLFGAPLFIHFFKINDYSFAIVGLFGTMLMYTILALTTKPWMLFVVPLIDVLGGVTIPCIRSLMSKNAEKDEQGALFSTAASVEVLCSLVASVLFNNIYSATVAWHAGFCFFMMSLVLVVPVLICWYLRKIDPSVKYKEFKAENAADVKVLDENIEQSHSGGEPINYSS